MDDAFHGSVFCKHRPRGGCEKWGDVVFVLADCLFEESPQICGVAGMHQRLHKDWFAGFWGLQASLPEDVGCNARMVELGLQLLYVGCFHCLQLFLRNGMLYGDGHKAMIVVVVDPPSDCQLCVHNFVLLYLLVFATATGLPVLQVVLTAPNVPEFGELPVQGETHVYNAVSIVGRKGVCFGRNALSVEQLTRCLHLGAVVVAMEMKDPN